jgi:hypothetical protein
MFELDSKYENQNFLHELDFWGFDQSENIAKKELFEILDSVPENLISKKLHNIWKNKGPIDLKKWIDEGKIAVDSTKEFKIETKT